MILETIHLISRPTIVNRDRVLGDVVQHKLYSACLIRYLCITRSIVPIPCAKLRIQLNADLVKTVEQPYLTDTYGYQILWVWTMRW